MTQTEYAVELLGITKKFGSLVANDNVNIKVKKGSVHAIVGENGAGKSTVVKVLNGFYRLDAGSIRIHGKTVQIRDTLDAISFGVGTVHQHFMLINALTVLDNIILGKSPNFFGKIDWKKAREDIEALMAEFQLEVDLDAPIDKLPVGVKQRVEILKAVYRRADILVLDEPSAVLTPMEVEGLFKIIRKFIAAGKTVMIITHKLLEVMEISDAVTVMRSGKVVTDLPTKQTSVQEIAGLMVGRQLKNFVKPEKKPTGVLLEVQNLCLTQKKRRILHNINFSVRSGEIVGIAGVSGNGQIFLEECLSGLITDGVSGEIRLRQQPIQRTNAKERRQMHISHVPADRIERGFVANFSNEENLVLGYHLRAKMSKWSLFLRFVNIAKYCKQAIVDFDIRPPLSTYLTARLSGGNQQKVIVAREMEAHPDVLVIAEPTRGVDIGSIELIHNKILEARDQGVGIVLFSSELSEIKKLADISYVMHDGQFAGKIDWEKSDEKEIGMLMIGAQPASDPQSVSEPVADMAN